VSIVADTRGLARLARDLRRASPEAWKAYRVRVREVAEVVLKDAQSRASYSSRIPQTGKVRVLSSGNVVITFGGDAAPDAAPIENKGKGFVRHPVFGNRDKWTSKGSHPAFAAPALDAHAEEVMRELEAAVCEAVERVVGGGL
jgi:hypothetical protein